MKTSRLKIAKIIADQTLKSGESKKLARSVGAYLLETGRVGELSSVLRDIQADWAKNGYIEVVASSAHDLTRLVKEDIKSIIKVRYPKAKRIIITEVYDPNIIGGVRLNLADQQLDLSIEAKLTKFKLLTLSGKEN
jgi:F0F1-type ATP synthase delta subunit